MKKNAVLINCSRGELIDEAALLDHLKRNENFKAILDCFQNEPYKGPLCRQNNVTLSPHIASFTDETRNLMEQNSFLNCVKNIDLKKLSEKINIKDYSTIFIDFDGTIKQSDEVKGKLFYEIFGV